MRRIFEPLAFGIALACTVSNVHAIEGMKEKNDTESIEQARVYHILFNSPQDAERTYKTLSAATSDLAFQKFKSTAQQESKDPGSAKSGGDLGMVKEGEMVKDFEEAVFRQKLLTISKPFKSAFGWHIIYVTEKGSKSIASICKEGLTDTESKATEANKAALRFSLQANSPQDLHPGVLRFIGDGWSSPMKDWHGDLAYFRKSTSRAKSNVVEVEQHTEYVHAIYNPAPQTCRRSALSTFEVNCTAHTVKSRSRKEFEGRALSGRKLIDWKWSPSEAQVYSANDGFMGQLAAYACAPNL